MFTAKISETEQLTKSALSNIALIEDAFNIHNQKVSDLIGEYRSCWIGYSSDEEIRKKAASGGVVTELLLYALKTGVVDKVLVSKVEGLNSRLILTNDYEDILSCQGSIYCEGNNLYPIRIQDARTAVVALPCQIKRLRNNGSNPLIIGLFCGHKIQRKGMEFLLKYLGIDIDRVSVLRYRDKYNEGDTGLLIRWDKNAWGTKPAKFIQSHKYYGLFFNFFFIPRQCMKCSDQTAELADISCGDAWLRGHTGESIFVARTERGEQLVKSLINSGSIIAEPTFGENVIKSQKKSLYLKKNKGMKLYKLIRKIGNYISNRPRLHFIMRLYLRMIGIKP